MTVNEGEDCNPTADDTYACAVEAFSSNSVESPLLPPIDAIRGILTRELQVADCRIKSLNKVKPPEDAVVERRIDYIRESACKQGARGLIKRIQGGVEMLGQYDTMLPELDIPSYDTDPTAAFIDVQIILLIAKEAAKRKAQQLRDGNPGDVAPLAKQFDYVRESAVVKGESEARSRLVVQLDELQLLYGGNEHTAT